jgi:hypothetical protein
MTTALSEHERSVVTLLRKIGERRPSDRTIQWVDCGLHSGFPPCCITFFVKTWAPLHLHRKASKTDRVAMKEYRDAMLLLIKRGELEHGYVPCPDCFRDRRFVVVQECSRHLKGREIARVRAALA